jgi:uncharacterized BrkB/YihY/UPF0761 family membrane protein
MLGGDPPLLSLTTSPNIIAQTRLRRTFFPLRWKLLIITSLVAALVNAGGIRTLAYWRRGDATMPSAVPPGTLAGLAIILLVTTLAFIFVYRHTARRRKLQASLTALFAVVLTLAALFASSMFLRF